MKKLFYSTVIMFALLVGCEHEQGNYVHGQAKLNVTWKYKNPSLCDGEQTTSQVVIEVVRSTDPHANQIQDFQAFHSEQRDCKGDSAPLTLTDGNFWIRGRIGKEGKTFCSPWKALNIYSSKGAIDEGNFDLGLFVVCNE